MKREIQKICSRHIFVIPNGIDFSRFSGLSREKARGELHINPDTRIILFVGGALRPEKGLRYLIEAMGIVSKKFPRSRLLLIGYKGKECELETQTLQGLVKELDLGKLVSFIGTVPHEKIPQYMVASDVFVLASLSEGFPNVLLEAMAAGLPIVATNVMGLPEIIKDGENGFLVEPKDPEGIAEKVLQLLGDDGLRQRVSKNNQERVKAHSWEGVIDRLEEVYASLNVSRL